MGANNNDMANGWQTEMRQLTGGVPLGGQETILRLLLDDRVVKIDLELESVDGHRRFFARFADGSAISVDLNSITIPPLRNK